MSVSTATNSMGFVLSVSHKALIGQCNISKPSHSLISPIGNILAGFIKIEVGCHFQRTGRADLEKAVQAELADILLKIPQF